MFLNLREKICFFSRYFRYILNIIAGGGIAGPRQVMIDVILRCNVKCVPCAYHSEFAREHESLRFDRYFNSHFRLDGRKIEDTGERPSMLSWDIFQSLAAELDQIGTEWLTFVGWGEPFLHPRIMDMLEYSRSRHLKCRLSSNGLLLTPERIERIGKGNLIQDLIVSILAGSAETWVRMHPGQTTEEFDTLMNQLKIYSKVARRNHSKLTLTQVICGWNYEEIPQMVQQAIDVRANKLTFLPIFIREGIEDLAFPPGSEGDVRRLLKEAHGRTRESNISCNAEDLVNSGFSSEQSGEKNTRPLYQRIPCYWTSVFSRILLDGAVVPCCSSSCTVGKLGVDGGFKDIWFGSTYRSLRKDALNLPRRDGVPLKGCDCSRCGEASNNIALDRRLKWFSFYRRRRGKKS